MKGTDGKRLTSRSALGWLLALIPVILPAQSIWVDRADNRYVSVEILKPNLKNDRSKLAKYGFFLSLHLPVSDSTRMAFELPLAYAAYRDYHYDFMTPRPAIIEKSETAVGNPYIGIEMPVNTNMLVEMGFRVPLASEKKYNALSAGMSCDFDRIEAFAVKLLPLQMSLTAVHRDPSGLVIRLRGGPDLWISTDSKTEGDKTELWMHYSAQAGFDGKHLNVLAGVTGRLWISQSDLNFGERSFHQVGINAGIDLGRFRPGLFARFPLDKDLSDYLENVIGLNCSIGLE
jgi:hypothetical protein